MLFMKKLLKGNFFALLAVLLGFSACTEPAVEVLSQVYFSKENAGIVDIAVDAKSFDVEVKRIDATGNARVPMTVTADSIANAWFNFPDAVEFADAALSAVYTVTVKDGAVLEYDRYAKISLAIAGEYLAALGDAVHSFEVGVPAPWSEWEKVGEGTYYPSVYWCNEEKGLALYYRECLVNDTDAQYRIEGIQNTMNLTVEFNRQTGACQVLPQYAATNYKYGQVTVTDIPHSPLAGADGTYEDNPCTYDAENGLFVFNLAYVVSTQWGGVANESFGSGVERFLLDGFVKQDADYSFAMQFRGNYVDEPGMNNAIISTVKGADVAMFLMTVVRAGESDEVVSGAMLAGTVPCDTLTEAGFYAFPIAESGDYKAVAITFDVDANPIKVHSTDFEFWLAGESDPWQSLGYALYTDDVISPFLGMPVSSHYVEVLENKEQPGMFRVMDPYGPEFAYFSSATSYVEGSYIDIDATDPQAVWIMGWQSTGFDNGDGEITVTSMAWYKADALEVSKEEVKEAGFCGTYVDGVITFPVDGLFVGIGTKAYYGNRNGAFALDMTNMLEAIPESAAAARNVAVSAEVKQQGEPVGKVLLFKKIDNSCLTPTAM